MKSPDFFDYKITSADLSGNYPLESTLYIAGFSWGRGAYCVYFLFNIGFIDEN